MGEFFGLCCWEEVLWISWTGLIFYFCLLIRTVLGYFWVVLCHRLSSGDFLLLQLFLSFFTFLWFLVVFWWWWVWLYLLLHRLFWSWWLYLLFWLKVVVSFLFLSSSLFEVYLVILSVLFLSSKAGCACDFLLFRFLCLFSVLSWRFTTWCRKWLVLDFLFCCAYLSSQHRVLWWWLPVLLMIQGLRFIFWAAGWWNWVRRSSFFFTFRWQVHLFLLPFYEWVVRWFSWWLGIVLRWCFWSWFFWVCLLWVILIFRTLCYNVIFLSLVYLLSWFHYLYWSWF